MNTFDAALLQDPTLKAMYRAGLTYQDMIVALVAEKRQLLAELMRLQQIAPFRIDTPDGPKIWRCPDHLVPAP